MVLRLAGQGEPAPPGGLPGDLLVRVRLQRHHYLQRDADDLYTRIEIDFASAALGTKVDVPGLDQERLKIMISPGTQSGTRLRLRGRGMPRLRAKGKGDLYVIVEVRTPTDLTPRQRELLQEFKMETNRKATAAP
jgi:molecular chaperone DnaJ